MRGIPPSETKISGQSSSVFMLKRRGGRAAIHEGDEHGQAPDSRPFPAVIVREIVLPAGVDGIRRKIAAATRAGGGENFIQKRSKFPAHPERERKGEALLPLMLASGRQDVRHGIRQRGFWPNAIVFENGRLTP